MLDLGLAVVIWGFSFSLAKISLSSLTPFELVTIRLFLGSVTGFCLLRVFDLKSFRANRFHGQWRNALVMGLFEFAGTYLLYTWSLKFLPSGVVGTLTLMTPALTYLVGMMMAVDIFSWRALFAIAVSLVGAALSLPLGGIFGSFQLSSDALWGGGLILASNMCFAIGNTMITKFDLGGRWNNSLTFQGQGIGAGIALMVLILTGGGSRSVTYFTNFDLKIWILPLYLGVVATGIGFFLWNRGVQKVSSTRASLVGNLKAPLSVIWGAVILHESVTMELIIGLLFLISSIYILPKKLTVK